MKFLTIVAAVLLSMPAVPAGLSAQQTGASPQPDARAGTSNGRATTSTTDSGQPSQGSAVAPVARLEELPVSLGRIRRALETPPKIRVLEPQLRNGRQVYRVDVEADKIDLEAILGPDFTRGPASYGGMTHAEFLDIVTPEAVRGYAAYSNREGMMVAATSIALQWAALKAIDALKKAKDENAREAARDEVREALEALKKARRAAGLPDR